MVWFQCEDCGENLKKPKLLIHFNRCSANKLSCIDCGVVFDRQSVQAHTSCVTEEEKYGPKGSSRGAKLPASAVAKETGPDVDSSRGLSTFAPWSCSLCNVKTTSRETLEQHSQGKKHRSKARSAAAKEQKSVTESVPEATAVATIACIGDSDSVQPAETASDANASVLLAMERRSQKERALKAEDPLAAVVKSEIDLEKKSEEVATLAESGVELRDSKKKKRKHVEEQQKPAFVEEERVSGKKSRKRDGINGHDSSERTQQLVAECSDGKENKLHAVLDKGVDDMTGVSVGDNTVAGLSARDANVATNIGEAEGLPVTHRKLKKLRASGNAEQKSASDATASLAKGKVQKDLTKGKLRKSEKRDTSVHEVSFREWLGGEGQAGEDSRIRSATESSGKAKENLQEQERLQRTIEAIRKLESAASETSQSGATKAVKWKKIIREVIAKLIGSVSGRLKKKDLTRAMLPLAIESSAASVDRKVLKAELMRRISSSPKFVVDGKHIMLSPSVKS